MTQLTMNLAVTHDHWFTEPTVKHAGAVAKLWWRHLERHHPVIYDVLNWSTAAFVASGLLIAQLIANA